MSFLNLAHAITQETVVKGYNSFLLHQIGKGNPRGGVPLGLASVFSIKRAKYADIEGAGSKFNFSVAPDLTFPLLQSIITQVSLNLRALYTQDKMEGKNYTCVFKTTNQWYRQFFFQP